MIVALGDSDAGIGPSSRKIERVCFCLPNHSIDYNNTDISFDKPIIKWVESIFRHVVK